MKAGTVEAICRSVGCPKCGVSVGRLCVTSSGRLRAAHADRWRLVKDRIDEAVDIDREAAGRLRSLGAEGS